MMNLFTNPLAVFLRSGFGTGSSAGKAAGWTLFILLSVFMLVAMIIVKIVKAFLRHREAAKAAQKKE